MIADLIRKLIAIQPALEFLASGRLFAASRLDFSIFPLF
jgi:hypothetical protein